MIGIGASAGGLEALEQFFSAVDAAAAVAYVVIPHRDPAQTAQQSRLLPELLARVTPLPIVDATDGLTLAAGTIYLMPSHAELTLDGDVLHLHPLEGEHAQRRPIDRFFTALADARQPLAVGVVLSGMGADGTLGLRRIKERGGASFVQSPEQARFDSMPRSAIENGVADEIALAAQLPVRCLAFLASAARQAAVDAALEERHPAIDEVIALLRRAVGHDFAQYKRSTLARRIQRRISLHHLDSIEAYVLLLASSPSEATLLFAELLIGVTSFFRDPAVWEQLRDEVLPALIRESAGGSLRAWIAGTSTGEEAYSLAIVFLEAVALAPPALQCGLQIFATALDQSAIARARAGSYPLSISADVSPERLQRFFVREDGRFRVNSRVREMVIFAPHNVTVDPPFTKLDLLLCRNLLIYLTPPLQKQLMELFHFSLRPDGFLVLGTAETVGPIPNAFATIPGKGRLYVRSTRNMPLRLNNPSRTVTPVVAQPSDEAPENPSLQQLTDRMLLERFTPAAVLIGEAGDILYVSGRTGRYLEPAAGKANWNVFAMAHPELALAIADGCQRARREQDTVRLGPIEWRDESDRVSHTEVMIAPVPSPADGAELQLVVFRDLPVPAPLADGRRRRTAMSPSRREVEAQLRDLKDQLRMAREERQISNEELRSTNEELQSTNEELQSANEELTTSKEEMQSMNEELQTVNQELQAKLDELTLSSTDMSNLLDALDIATLFLDRELKVRRFTVKTAGLINLIATDVGRPVTDIVSSLAFPEMADEIRSVLRTNAPSEREVASADGRWFAARIIPYHTHDRRVDGVVLTFTDITKAKVVEAGLRHEQP